MDEFKYISRNYISPINLEVLGKTYSTLEEGHKEAVKASSDLRTTVANLPMNAAEDGFKQQLVREIETLVRDNTVFGNISGAVDDLIQKVGDINSDGRIIGRIRNNAAKLEYDKKVDAAAIPDGMKTMYKEENPYYYEDGAVDLRTGRTLPGKEWKAITNPVKSINLADIQKHALAIAAKEKGNNVTVSYLDANGRPTTDINKSVDGQMYSNNTVTFERLTPEAVARAYRVAIDSIAGAEDSLRQDYKYDNYLYKKEVERISSEGGNIAPYIEGFTDKNGNKYSYDTWLNNKINSFKDVPAYNHVFSDINFNTALQAKMAERAAAKSKGVDGYDSEGNPVSFGTTLLGYDEVEHNGYASSLKTKLQTNNTALNLAKKALGENYGNYTSVSDLIEKLKLSGPGNAANYLIQQAGNKLNDIEKTQLVNALTGYVHSNKIVKQYEKAAGRDMDTLKFSANMANEEYTNDNEYGKLITNWLNYQLSDSDSIISSELGDEVWTGMANYYDATKNEFMKMFNGRINSDGNLVVDFTAANRNKFPKFNYYLNQFSANKIGAVNSDNYGVRGIKDVPKAVSTAYSGNLFDSYYLYELYNKGKEKSSTIEKKIGIERGIRSTHISDNSSLTEAWFRANRDRITDTNEEVRKKINDANERLDNMFASAQYSSGRIKEISPSGRGTKLVTNAQAAQDMIQRMYQSKPDLVTRNVVITSNGETGENVGYSIAFTVPKDMGNDVYKEGQSYRFIVYDTSKEEKDYNPNYNTTNIANDIVQISKATNTAIDNIGYNDYIGNTTMNLNKKGNYDINIFGTYNEIPASKANDYVDLFLQLEQFKISSNNHVYNIDPYKDEVYANAIAKIANKFAEYTNANPITIQNALINYINEE